ncbi:MAG: recombinase family protein [Bifidobacteriaceae bacterium]|jgi:DNA invertase Pin-like site-specific DNA recombinase|nr:recombinase family protein [Bifidobacteriaceae bacterium]
MSNVVGYARVSTREQNPEAQEDELRAAGATRVFVEQGESSRVKDRPQWLACLDYLRPGDTLVVRRLDRIAGSERMAIEAISNLAERGVNIRSLTEPDIDTTTPMGGALFGIVAIFAQLRVDTIRENTRRGLEQARAQGRVGGRPSVMTPKRVTAAAHMRAEGKTIMHIASVLEVGKSTVARALAKLNEETPGAGRCYITRGITRQLYRHLTRITA